MECFLEVHQLEQLETVFFLIFIDVLLIYNVVLVLGVKHS